MITVTGRDTCKPAYIDEALIEKITEHTEDLAGRAYPYSRVYIKDPKQHYEYYLDVVESKAKIATLIEEERNRPPKIKKGVEEE